MYRSYIDVRRMRWCEFFIGFCFLFASFWSKSENCADGRIEKRGVEKEYFDDSEFIRALSQQLYSRDENEIRRDDADDAVGGFDDAVGGFVVDEKEENKAKRDLKPRETKVDQSDEGKKENPDNNGDGSKSRSSGGGAADGVTVPYVVAHKPDEKEGGNGILIIIIAACVIVGVVALIGASVCVYGLHDKKKQVQQIHYTPSHTHQFIQVSPQSGENYSSNIFQNEKNMAISAERFHFQHEKQKIMAMENEDIQNEAVNSHSVNVTDEIYATAGMAPMWDVEFISPVYTEDVTPGTTPRDVTPVFRRNSDEGGSGSGENGGVTRPLTNGRKTPESPEQQQPQQQQRSNDSNPTSASTNARTNNNIYPNLEDKTDVKINGINDHLESEDEQ